MPESWMDGQESATIEIGPTSRNWFRGAALNRAWSLVALFSLSLTTTSWGQKLEAEKTPGREGVQPSEARADLSDGSGVDLAAARSETVDRLRALETATSRPAVAGGSAGSPAGAGSPRGAAVAQAPSSGPTTSFEHAADKSIRDVLSQRIGWLDDFETLTHALQKALNPDPNPDTQRALADTELSRLQDTLKQTAVSPDALLPSVFRNPRRTNETASASEMRNALEAERNDLKQWEAKLEALRMEIAKAEGLQSKRQSERDQIFQRVATLKAKRAELEQAVTAALTSDARQLAREKLVNFEWELRVENLRLRLTEAQLVLERKIARVRELNVQIGQTKMQIMEKRRQRMEAHYKAIVERQEQDLSRAAASEETKARRADDPLDRFKARRTAEILSLEAQVVKSEQALATTPSPSLHEERQLADRAEADFAGIKHLLDDGDVSRLDAVRLNNEFRRIALERERLVRNEKTAVEAHLQYYEEALTGTEIELLSDSTADRFDRDLLRDRLPQSRWLEAETILGQLEEKHRTLLERRRETLQKLCDRASETHQQVIRRLAILDEEYGFIRTHIFWVRDQEPLGLWAVSQGGREIQQLVRGSVRLAQETAKPTFWAQPSGEFLAVSAAVCVLPLGLIRLRRAIRHMLESKPNQ